MPFLKVRLLLCLFFAVSRLVLAATLEPRDSPSEAVSLDANSWEQYKVDQWLVEYMTTHNIPKAHFLTEFPKAVGQELKCALSKPCRTVPSLPKNATDEEVKIHLVLAALTHFNDVFRMVALFFSNPNGIPGTLRGATIDSFSNIYHDFTPEGINSSVPAADVAQTFFSPVWYVPNLLPNTPMVETVKKAIKRTAEKGFGYTWEDHATYGINEDHTNIDWSLQNALDAWLSEYHGIIADTKDISILDFLRDGAMLRLQYGKDVDPSWLEQASDMYQRLTLSLVLEANGVLIHRASYEGMEPNDTSMSLVGYHDDAYLHIIYAPIHWGHDEDGNLTRQYDQSQNINSYDIAPRVVYGQSWACFKATNSDQFKNNYAKPWDQPGYYDKSLYIKNWDGTSDGLDAQNPLCTFNIPVNNQPADIKQSDFVQNFNSSCPQAFENFNWLSQVDYAVYRAFMIASDAWASALIAINTVNPDLPAKLSDLCSSSDDAVKSWGKEILSDLWGSFKMNMLIGAVLGIRETVKGIADGAGSIYTAVRGGWNRIFLEKPPVIRNPPGPPLSLDSAHVGSGGDGRSGLGDGNPNGNGNNDGPDPSPAQKPAISWQDMLKHSQYGHILDNGGLAGLDG